MTLNVRYWLQAALATTAATEDAPKGWTRLEADVHVLESAQSQNTMTKTNLMSLRRTSIKLSVLWLRFVLLGVWSALFGWAAFVATVVLACLPQVVAREAAHLPPWSPLIVREDVALQTALLGLLIAVAVSLLWSAVVVAPRKAWCSQFPLSIRLAKSPRPPEIVQQTLQRHTVFVIVRNRSPIRSLYCNVAATQILGTNSSQIPWSIWGATIAPNDECRVEVARWFFNEGRQTDNIFVMNEVSAAYHEANQLSFPQSGAEMCLTVRAEGFKSSSAWCRVLVQDRQLFIEEIEQADSKRLDGEDHWPQAEGQA